MTLVGILLLFLVGMVVFRVQFEGNLFSLLAGITRGHAPLLSRATPWLGWFPAPEPSS